MIKSIRLLSIILLPLSLLILAYSCGGGGGSGTTSSGPPAGSTVTITSDADFVACESSATVGVWTALAPTGVDTYECDAGSAGGSYGLVFHFTGTGATDLFQFTRDDIWDVVNLSDPTATHNVSGTLSNVPATDTVEISIAEKILTGLIDGPYDFGITIPSQSILEGLWDIVAVDFDNLGVPQQYKIIRDVNVNTVITGQDFDFSSAIALTPHTLSATDGVSNAEGAVELYTENGTRREIGRVTGTGPWFAASSGTMAGDRYTFIATDNSVQMNRTHIQVFDATSDPGDLSFDIGSIPSLTGISVPSASIRPTYNGLSYTPAISSPPLLSYVIEETQGLNTIWTIALSKAWLDANSATSYTVPDLSGVPGWQPSYDLQTGTQVDWKVWALTSNLSPMTFMQKGGDPAKITGNISDIAFQYGNFTP